MVWLSCALVPLTFVLGVLTILLNYFDFRGVMTYVKGNLWSYCSGDEQCLRRWWSWWGNRQSRGKRATWSRGYSRRMIQKARVRMRSGKENRKICPLRQSDNTCVSRWYLNRHGSRWSCGNMNWYLFWLLVGNIRKVEVDLIQPCQELEVFSRCN